MRVVGNTVVLGIAPLVRLRVCVRARVLRLLRLLLLLLLLLCRGLAVMLLMDNARGSRVLQMGGDRTLLLLVVGVMLHRGDNH
jgi:hypothetical protein